MTTATRPTVVFHAPLKPPDHPTPSGDRAVARLFWRVLETIGYAPWLAREPRSRDGRGDPEEQERLIARGAAEAARLIALFRAMPAAERPALWFTYHVYYKAPDLIGPAVSQALGIPYVIAEASRSPKRLDGPWRRFAALAESAIDQARVVLCPTERDYPALERARPGGQTLLLVPPFLDPGLAPERAGRSPGDPVRLITVAMARPGAKMASYALLAEALARIDHRPWTLTIIGGGEGEAEVRALFARFGARVDILGAQPPETIPAHLDRADLFVWPGIGEAFGMVYLEAQARGLPVIACDGPGVRAVVANAAGRPRPAAEPEALARTLAAILDAPERLEDEGRAARQRVLRDHALTNVAERLSPVLRPLTEERAA